MIDCTGFPADIARKVNRAVTRRRIIAECAIEAHQFARRLSEDVLPEYIFPNLMGACAIASAYLHKRLGERGIASRICLGAQHAYVRVDELYVDVTCEQFGHEPIWIAPTPPSPNPGWFEEFSTTDLHDLMTEMKAGSWAWDARQIHELVVEIRHAA